MPRAVESTKWIFVTVFWSLKLNFAFVRCDGNRDIFMDHVPFRDRIYKKSYMISKTTYTLCDKNYKHLYFFVSFLFLLLVYLFFTYEILKIWFRDTFTCLRTLLYCLVFSLLVIISYENEFIYVRTMSAGVVITVCIYDTFSRVCFYRTYENI